jgi:hypothetical protein
MNGGGKGRRFSDSGAGLTPQSSHDLPSWSDTILKPEQPPNDDLCHALRVDDDGAVQVLRSRLSL